MSCQEVCVSATNANFIIESYVINMSTLIKKESWYYRGYVDHGNTMGLSLTFSSEKNPVHQSLKYACHMCMPEVSMCVYVCFSIDVHCETGWAAHAV